MVTNLADLVPEACEIRGADSGLIDVDGAFLSWNEVRPRINALASTLVEAGVVPGDRVAVAHPRTTASFIAVHAILAARAVMVPLDPLGPPAALADVLGRVEPVAVIGATPTILARISDFVVASSAFVVFNGEREPLQDLGISNDRLIDFQEALDSQPVAALPAPRPDDLAYIMFTSGSTGIPKGIMHTHASGLAYAEHAAQVHTLHSSDRIVGTSPLHFDISTFDLYASPLVGASTISVTEVELRFPASLTKRLQDTAASVIFCTPYQLQQFGQRGDLPNRDLTSMRQVAFGGEAFAPQTMFELMQAFPPAEWFNSYGPAEVNGVIGHSFPPETSELPNVPIGVPFPNVSVLLVDDDDKPVEHGHSGELLICSPSMMTGYWQRDDLNEEIFVTFNERIFYRTGDMAHVDDAGLFHFEGRRDNRIKVRGVRIELEEIERVVGDAPDVVHAVAGRVDDPDGMQHIVAWIVSDDELDTAELTNWCRTRLPANAVPTHFRRIDKVPTTGTGKIDRATLRADATL